MKLHKSRDMPIQVVSLYDGGTIIKTTFLLNFTASQYNSVTALEHAL